MGTLDGGCAKNGQHPDTMYMMISPHYGFCFSRHLVFADHVIGVSIRSWTSKRDRRAMCQRGKWRVYPPEFEEPNVWSLSHVRRRGWMKYEP